MYTMKVEYLAHMQRPLTGVALWGSAYVQGRVQMLCTFEQTMVMTIMLSLSAKMGSTWVQDVHLVLPACMPKMCACGARPRSQ